MLHCTAYTRSLRTAPAPPIVAYYAWATTTTWRFRQKVKQPETGLEGAPRVHSYESCLRGAWEDHLQLQEGEGRGGSSSFRREALKAESRGGVYWGSRLPTRGFRAFKALCLALMTFKHCLMLGFYPAEWWIPAKRCRISTVRYRMCY